MNHSIFSQVNCIPTFMNPAFLTILCLAIYQGYGALHFQIRSNIRCVTYEQHIVILFVKFTCIWKRMKLNKTELHPFFQFHFELATFESNTYILNKFKNVIVIY